MSKSIILLAVFIACACAFTQTPVPIPGLNADYLGGVWFAQWQYLANSTQNQSDFSCYTYTITVNDQSLDVVAHYTYNKTETSKNLTYTFGNGVTSSWNTNDNNSQNRTIVAWDYLENSWFLLVDNTAQNAIQFSKSQGPFNPFQLQAAIFILNKEGYNVNNGNSINYDNANCPQPSDL
jgi:hypothetical protein